MAVASAFLPYFGLLQLRKHLGQVLHGLAGLKEGKILKGHRQADHMRALVSIPPKYSVAQEVGFIKGKSAIHIARSYLGRCKSYTGMQELGQYKISLPQIFTGL